jgi:hypothetical protein
VGQVLFTAEVVAGICLLAVLSFLLLTYLRRRTLSRDGEVIVCSLRGMGVDRWRPGLLRRTDVCLEWYPMFGLTTRPSYRWGRLSVRLGNLAPSDRPNDAETDMANAGLFSGQPVLVPVEVRGADGQLRTGELALAPAPYTAVRAWVEAAPPGARPV